MTAAIEQLYADAIKPLSETERFRLAKMILGDISEDALLPPRDAAGNEAQNGATPTVQSEQADEKPNTLDTIVQAALAIKLNAPPDFIENLDDYLYGGKSLRDE